MQGSVVNPDRKAKAVRKKVTVAGAGNVGANCALPIAGKQLAGVVLVDVAEGIPMGRKDLRNPTYGPGAGGSGEERLRGPGVD